MAKYIQQDVESVADYDEYCHFVAGLVGVGLSQVSIHHWLVALLYPIISVCTIDQYDTFLWSKLCQTPLHHIAELAQQLFVSLLMLAKQSGRYCCATL